MDDFLKDNSQFEGVLDPGIDTQIIIQDEEGNTQIWTED